jgi:hypothetical protein
MGISLVATINTMGNRHKPVANFGKKSSVICGKRKEKVA